MARLTLSPSALTKTASPTLDLTAALTALGANTGVSFSNSGREFLAISCASGSTSTCTVNIGTTIEGQAVSALTPSLTTSHLNLLGPFPADENQTGGLIYVDFGTPANVTVACVQFAGVN